MNPMCCVKESCGRPERPRCDGEYIIERIIGKYRQKCCYQGILSIGCGEQFCPPLYLKHIEVVNIASIWNQTPCLCGMQRLCLTLVLLMTDGRGRPYQTNAQIELEIQNPTSKPNVGLENVRRGARICVERAQYCHPAGFDVELLIELETIMTRCEVAGCGKDCAPVCPQLPLYPPPPCIVPEHSWRSCRANSSKDLNTCVK